jgi:hypothetical protein
MFIQNNNLPNIHNQHSISNNNNLSAIANQKRVVGLKTMSFKSPMIERVANSRPSCGACGKH